MGEPISRLSEQRSSVHFANVTGQEVLPGAASVFQVSDGQLSSAELVSRLHDHRGGRFINRRSFFGSLLF